MIAFWRDPANNVCAVGPLPMAAVRERDVYRPDHDERCEAALIRKGRVLYARCSFSANGNEDGHRLCGRHVRCYRRLNPALHVEPEAK